jgi:hypothetical protein
MHRYVFTTIKSQKKSGNFVAILCKKNKYRGKEVICGSCTLMPRPKTGNREDVMCVKMFWRNIRNKLHQIAAAAAAAAAVVVVVVVVVMKKEWLKSR